ncbi:MAG: hemolysin family protein [Gemmatimonadota bacterium]
MDSSELALDLLGLAALMACSAFFSGSETAFSALGKSQTHRLRGEDRVSSRYVVAFLDNPRRFFITVLFGNILVNIAFVTITGSLIYHRLFQGRDPGLASAVAILLEMMALLILGEVTPKTYAIGHAEGFARGAALPLWLFSQLIYPFRRLLRLLTDAVFGALGIHGGDERHRITGEELRAFIEAAEDGGVIDAHEAEVIGNIFELCDIDAKEIMTPRTEMVAVEVSATIGQAFARAREAGFSRLPVYRGDTENICGIFLIKDLPQWWERAGDAAGVADIEAMTIEQFLLHRAEMSPRYPGTEDSLVRQPFFSYEAKGVGPLMREMTRRRQRMAILLNEYGGVAGLVTIQDIVEEVVGEIADRHDRQPQPTITRSPEDPRAYLIPGLTSLRTVNKKCHVQLHTESAETMAGYVVNLMGAIPAAGDRVTDTAHAVAFEIVAMDGPRVDVVRMRRTRRRDLPPMRGLLLVPAVGATVAMGSGAAAATPAAAIWLFAATFVVALFFIAFFAGSETAVVSASRELIDAGAEKGDRRAAVVRALLSEPDRFLATVLVGTNLATTVAGQSGVMLASYALPGQPGLQEILNTALVTPIVLVFCEILPKTLFHARADSLALKTATALRVSTVVLRPIVVLVTAITRRLARPRDPEQREPNRITRDELMLLASMGKSEDRLPPEQLQMIRNVLGSETRTIDRIMVPLVNIAAVAEEATTENLYAVVTETGYSRLPVYQDRIDNIVGYVAVRDVLFADHPSPVIAPFVHRDVAYEPETRQALSLLRQLRLNGHPLAIVVDEYGGVIGLVTTEDLVEEIMGEIRDERDEDVNVYIRRLSAGVFDADGRAEVHEVNRYAGTDIPPGNYETVAGYVLFLVQRIPRQGEHIETDSLRLTVLDSDARRVRRVRLQKKR